MPSDDKSLKDRAQEKLNDNPSAIGDPVSLKNEQSSGNPAESEAGAKDRGERKKTLKEAAMDNPSLLGDPVSLKAETADSEPTEHDRGALNDTKKRDSKL